MTVPRVAIVGGGVSGLSAAYYLGQRGIDTLLLEKESRTGGLIRTEQVENCLLEAGPDSFLAAKPAVTELASEIDSLQQQIIASNDAGRLVYIVRDGKLVPLPRGLSMMVPGHLKPALGSPLFSAGTKLRIVTERFAAPRERSGEISVAELVRDHFGQELVDYLAEPLLAGVYGGHASSLSAQSVLPRFVEYERRYGSLIRGVQKQVKTSAGGPLFQSFAGGMRALTDTLQREVLRKKAVFRQGAALAVERRNRGWRISLTEGEAEAEHLILACPAHSTARLLEKTAPQLAAELNSIPYSSAILVTLLYAQSEIEHPLNGFGFLVPQRERRTIAATTWINRKFPSRIAPGLIAIRAFVVGDEALRLRDGSDRELEDLVKQDIARLMGIAARPRKVLTQRWPDSMPQYVVGHEDRTRRIRANTAELPSLYLIGNAYEGVGIPDCVRLAKAAARQIAHAIN